MTGFKQQRLIFYTGVKHGEKKAQRKIFILRKLMVFLRNVRFCFIVSLRFTLRLRWNILSLSNWILFQILTLKITVFYVFYFQKWKFFCLKNSYQNIIDCKKYLFTMYISLISLMNLIILLSIISKNIPVF